MLPRWLQTFSSKEEGYARQGAASVGDPRQVSAPVGTTHNPAFITAGAAAPTQNICVDASQIASAGVGMSRRLLQEDVSIEYSFSPPDEVEIPPDLYRLLRFLTPDEIAKAFVEWMQTETRTAHLIGWPVTVDDVWKLAKLFGRESYIVIESRNNFQEALANRPEVKRMRNKHRPHGAGKTTVYRFSAADEQIARSERQSQVFRIV